MPFRVSSLCFALSLSLRIEIGKVVGGSSNKQLANEIAEELGLKCGKVKLGRYADGEVMVQLDEHVRGKGETIDTRIRCARARAKNCLEREN